MIPPQQCKSVSYRLSDIPISQDTSKLSRIASTFVMKERLKSRRMYDEKGCWLYDCGCDATCQDVMSTCDCIDHSCTV